MVGLRLLLLWSTTVLTSSISERESVCVWLARSWGLIVIEDWIGVHDDMIDNDNDNDEYLCYDTFSQARCWFPVSEIMENLMQDQDCAYSNGPDCWVKLTIVLPTKYYHMKWNRLSPKYLAWQFKHLAALPLNPSTMSAFCLSKNHQLLVLIKLCRALLYVNNSSQWCQDTLKLFDLL